MNGNAVHQARFMRKIAEALRSAADASTEYADSLDASLVSPDEAASEVEIPQARGPRQQQIVDVLASLDGDDGLKTADIADRVTMDDANAYLTLQALQKQGLVELVPGKEPQHWRLPAKYRLSRQIVEVGGLVRRGEWTSYGDISQVVYGHAKGGLAVGRVAARLGGDFPNPHRVLQFTGQIPDGWRDDEGLGREECARRLREEEVEVDDEFYAHGRHYVGHEVLASRLEEKRMDDEMRQRLRNIDDIEKFLADDDA